MKTNRLFLRSLTLSIAVLFLCGCRSQKWQTADIPESLSVPANFVAVLHDSATGQTTVFGDRNLAEYRYPPCSTFKIVSTLMGLDSGILRDAATKLGYDGTRYEIKSWNNDLSLAEAFRYSSVPYYKKLTGRLKKSYVQTVLDRLEYGNCNISVWNSNGHNVFWIESSLLISPLEQIRVVGTIFSGNSGFSPECVAILKECMQNEKAGIFSLYGKTGTGRNHNTNRLEAWYVGFIEAPDGKKIFFAAHGGDPARDVTSAEIREDVRTLMTNYEEGL